VPGNEATEGFPSIHDIRRRAPAHYWAKADNARYAAYLLSRGLSQETLHAAADGAGYHGTPGIAAWEAFRREAALALELIVKAVIAQRIRLGLARSDLRAVPLTHDVPALWREADLPELSNEDRRRLVLVKSLLSWSGRYAAPKTDAQFERERAEDERLKPPRMAPGIRFETPLSFDWESFDHLYQIASGTIQA
jgi:hypothetical protein